MKHKHHFHTYLLYIYFIMYLSSYFMSLPFVVLCESEVQNMIVSIHYFNMTSENLINGTEHSGNRALALLCLRRGCSLVTVSPGASILLTSVPASGRGKQEYFSVLRNSRILRNSMTLTALARVTTHYSADDTIHNCQQHCSVKFDFTIFQFQHLQHLASSSLGNELIAVVCDWRI